MSDEDRLAARGNPAPVVEPMSDVSQGSPGLAALVRMLSGDLRLLDRGLPKWPQMLVTGAPLEQEVAMEVIRRTDTFLADGHGGNDREWAARTARALRLPRIEDLGPTTGVGRDGEHVDRLRTVWERQEAWQEAWGLVRTEYVHNSWMACSFIGGPHGWCHPDGRVGYVDNVGKHPAVAEMARDWVVLAQAFPWLDVGITLMSGEGCEAHAEPVVSFRVRGRDVRLVEPSQEDVHAQHPEAIRRTGSRPGATDEFLAAMAIHRSIGGSREHGIPPSWIERWAAHAKTLALPEWRS